MSIQTSVSLEAAVGIPGMLADSEDNVVVSAVCTSTITAGTYVELTLSADGRNWIAKAPNSTAATLGEGGIALYDPTHDPNSLPAIGATSGVTGSFQAKEVISVLRRGRAFVACDAATTAGSAGLLWGAANVQHPSSTAASATNTNGYFTIVASNTTVGTETTAVNGVTFETVVASGVALVEINRPKAG